MNKAIKKRTPLRASFTRTLNILKLEIEKDECDKGIVLDGFSKLENLMQEIKVLDDSIIDFMVEDDKIEESAMNKELEDTESYSDSFITIKRKVNDRLNINNGENRKVVTENECVNSNCKSKRYKLPKINIKPFDSQLINYLTFWSQFEKIHEDIELENCDKFQYLIQSVEPGTRARQMLESYPITSENYPKAVAALQERFGKKELLIEVYVREFLKLVIVNVQAKGKNKLPLSDLFTKVEAYLRSLESMGLDMESNAAWLYPMIESSLSDDLLKAWQRYTIVGKDDPESTSGANSTKSNLTLLMEFLRREVTGEERLKLARSGFEEFVPKDKYKENPPKRENKLPTVAGLFNAKEMTCLFCSKSHDTRECFTARSMTYKDKVNKLRQQKCCLKCFKPFHIAKDCKTFVRCILCDKAHHVLLCPELPEKGKGKQLEEKKAPIVQSTLANQTCTKEVALMILEVDLCGDGAKKRVRALLDSASQKSYVLKSTAKELGLKVLSTEEISHSLFGGVRTESKIHNKYSIRLNSPGKNKNYEFNFLDQDVICGNIPRLPKGPLLKELKKHKIWISDIGSGSPKIELLIGSDIYGKLLTGQIKQLKNGLTAIETKLGWTVCGELESSSTNSSSNCSSLVVTNLAFNEFKVADLWKLESIGIMDPGETLSKGEEEEMAQEQFLNALSRNDDGRYCVGLPWVNDPKDIPSNRDIAEKRLFNTTRRLKALKKFEDYDQVFNEWLEEGVIRPVPDNELEEKGHYLPHHPVLKPESMTTKIRPVFDASCKDGRSPSLNDYLVTGPNLIELIPSILVRFRENNIGVIADIRRAFLQIEISEQDRKYLRFLWWKDNKVQEFQHNRVVFGLRCSPFLLGAVIRHHLEKNSEESNYSNDKLSRSFYVDNCITSVQDTHELEEFVVKSTEVLAEAKMDLRMWQFGPESKINPEFVSDKSLIEGLQTTVPVLGLKWDRSDDTLMLCNKFEFTNASPSKREILSVTQSIFDPIGILAPVLLPAKLLIQEAWASKTSWDAPLPEEIQDSFKKWYNELYILSELKIPRRVGHGNRKNWTVHVFCDASQRCYATVIFLRCEIQEEVKVQLLGARSRLSPLKKMTIPRLELLACVLGARLSQFILKALDLAPNTAFFWTDSSTALAWIQRMDQWGTFVGNRVREICKLTDPQRWSFVPGYLNPADLPSRGCTPRQLLESTWWEGPDWLKRSSDTWPMTRVVPDEETIIAEKRKSPTLTLSSNTEVTCWFEKISKFSRIVRVLAWVRRFLRNAQKKDILVDKSLSGTELQEAENTLWRIVQSQSFEEASSSIKGLMVVRDEAGLIRVKTKILEREEDELSFRYPLLLPSKHHLTECLIRQYHLQNCHAGVQILVSKLRENYWILSARRIIRNIVRKCVACKRFSSRSLTAPPIQLPLDRVRDSAVFEITGVDLCGPLFIKPRAKAWIVLYTCAVYRAVHLELVTSLSTETFMQSLRRFIARRGRPSTIYSDNGTNFTGTANALKQIDWAKLSSQEQFSPIKWKFIPPTAAWWGGWWERLIRSVKTLLVRILGRASLTYEELLTVICDVESVINSRPLTYISDAADDLVPLTPSMFMQDIRQTGVPDLDVVDANKLNIRLKYCNTLRNEMRSRFKTEYLGQLVQKAKMTTKEVKVGDVVLVELENKKRLAWPMGRVEKIFPSRDGAARVAKVKTGAGSLVRPIQKLYLLEVTEEGDPVLRVGPEKRSRYGRLLKQPQRHS